MTQAEQLIRLLRGRHWYTTADMQSTYISTCPWKRIAETGHRYLRKGERIECRTGADGLKRWRVAK